MESFANGCHDDFRFFMSAEPAATAAAHIIPQGILESSIKITNEPPTGMQVLYQIKPLILPKYLLVTQEPFSHHNPSHAVFILCILSETCPYRAFIIIIRL